MVGNIRHVHQLVDRMRALEHRVHEATSERREEFPGGVAYFNDELPAVWSFNFLRLDRDCDSPALWADRLQAGVAHRKIVVEDAQLVARFGPELRARGYGEQELVALARSPGGTLDRDVRVAAAREIEGLLRAVNVEQSSSRDPAVIDQLVRKSFLYEERGGGRWLALFAREEPVAHCLLFSHDGLAQIEDVATLEAHRGRGYSRRVLEHALELAAADHDTVFMTAEANNWPLGFYERLGFAPVERRADYVLIVAG